MQLNYFHEVIKKKIINNAFFQIINLIIAKGKKAYLVGGCVRDLYVNEIPNDIDIVTNATTKELKKWFKKSCKIVGKRFPISHISINNIIYEVTSFKHLHSNIITNDVQERDFTINGLYYEAKENKIIDNVKGISDLNKKIVRCISDPRESFNKDPIRMLRMLRVVTKLNFNVEKNTLRMFHILKNNIIKASPIRLFYEFLKDLNSGLSYKWIETIEKFQCLNIFFKFIKNNDELNNLKKTFKIYDERFSIIKKYIHKSTIFTFERRIIPLSIISFIHIHQIITEIRQNKTHFNNIEIQTLYALVKNTLQQDILTSFFKSHKNLIKQSIKIAFWQVKEFRKFIRLNNIEFSISNTLCDILKKAL